MRIRFSIRLQLLIVSLLLLAIPWLGYKYVWELEQYLRAGQEQTLLGTARAVATALHERPALFDSQSAYLKNVRPGTDLYAPPIAGPVRLDGALGDWQSVAHLARQYGESQIVTRFGQAPPFVPVSMAFSHMVARHGNYLYAQFDVTDDAVIWRGENSLSVDRSDHLLIGLTNGSGELQRYIIAPYKSGWVNAYHLPDDAESYRAQSSALRIQGNWQQTENGYSIELRFPLSMTSGSLAFALVDVDDLKLRTKKYAIGTANPNEVSALGTVVTPSPEIERILAGLEYADSRVWVVDKHKRVLARAGNIQSSSGLNVPGSTKDESWWRYVEQQWLVPLYYRILTRPPADFVDELENAYALAGQDINGALAGESETLWRLTPDNKAVILSAAYPIFINKQVMGAVVVEQTTNGIRTLRNQALEELFNVILAVMLLGITALALFANRLSGRVRKLRDDTESVIDDNGKIVGQLPAARRFDEIGDLHHAFADVLGRLQQYNSYLENMASRLSHELRTPVAVVRSSLDMLEHASDKDQQQVFTARAQSGLARLSNILNSMSEATRLEHAIAQDSKEDYPIIEVIKGCVESYRHTYPERRLALTLPQSEMVANGSPELFAQMLDKVITNAVEFSAPDSTIEVNAHKQAKQLVLTVTNQGPVLPPDMKNQLLQSMVSVRQVAATTDDATPHLGLGLYIASIICQYHKGSIDIADSPDKDGVTVTVSIPVRMA